MNRSVEGQLAEIVQKLVGVVPPRFINDNGSIGNVERELDEPAAKDRLAAGRWKTKNQRQEDFICLCKGTEKYIKVLAKLDLYMKKISTYNGNPKYKGHPWSEDEVHGLYGGVHLVRIVVIQADSTGLYRRVGISRGWPL